MEITVSYSATIGAMGAMAVLMLVQVLLSDVIGIRAKHMPGAPVAADHSDLVFRASRTVANTNETIGVFLLVNLYSMLSGSSPVYTAYAAWGFVIARTLYALCYYGNFQTLRSTVFGLSLLCLIASLAIGAFT